MILLPPPPNQLELPPSLLSKFRNLVFIYFTALRNIYCEISVGYYVKRTTI